MQHRYAVAHGGSTKPSDPRFSGCPIHLPHLGVVDLAAFTVFRRTKLWLSAAPADVIGAACASGRPVGRLGLSDDEGWPLCVRAPAPNRMDSHYSLMATDRRFPVVHGGEPGSPAQPFHVGHGPGMSARGVGLLGPVELGRTRRTRDRNPYSVPQPRSRAVPNRQCSAPLHVEIRPGCF